MNNLLKLLQRYKTFLVFVLFQGVCFALIINQNNFHKTSVVNSANSITGSVYSTLDNFTAYLSLKKENEKLNAENAHLKMLLKGYQISEYNSFSIVNDSIRKLQYKIVSGKIINTFTKSESNYLTMNLGTINGVEPQMGVMNSSGIVGFVKDVSTHYATVVPIIHKKFLMSVAHQPSGASGLLQWTSDNSTQTATVINLPKYISLNAGDTIVSKGNDGIFLPNEPVGMVETVFIEDGSNYNSAIIKLSVDFSSVNSIHVVKNLLREEQKSLETKIEE